MRAFFYLIAGLSVSVVFCLAPDGQETVNFCLLKTTDFRRIRIKKNKKFGDTAVRRKLGR